MQEEVVTKVVEWIQAMGRGEKITDIEGEGYLYYYAQQQVKKEGKDGN